jgi:hypothetical protein
MLLLAGTLDPATPLSIQNGAKAAFTRANQTFVTMPGASHGVILNSKVSWGRPPCGTELVVGFLDNPSAPLDLTCVDRVAKVAFDSAASTENFFGTTNLWGE